VSLSHFAVSPAAYAAVRKPANNVATRALIKILIASPSSFYNTL
jgi:hypothetical protein